MNNVVRLRDAEGGDEPPRMRTIGGLWDDDLPTPRFVADGGVLLATTDPLTALDNLAFDLTVQTLEGRGNKLSAAHRDVLLNACIILESLANGSVQGRYVFDLPAGLGKTTLLVCWAKAMMAIGFDWSLAVCASRVEELIDIQKELTSGELAIPEDAVGLWHAKEDAAVPRPSPGGTRIITVPSASCC